MLDLGRHSPLTEHRTSSANHLFTLHTAAHADHRVAIPILHVKYRAQFLLGVGWGGMSYWVYVTLSCHNWKRNDFATAVPISFTSVFASHKCLLVGHSRHIKKTTFIGGYGTGITSLQSRFYISLVLRTRLIWIRDCNSVIPVPYHRCMVVFSY